MQVGGGSNAAPASPFLKRLPVANKNSANNLGRKSVIFNLKKVMGKEHQDEAVDADNHSDKGEDEELLEDKNEEIKLRK